MFQGEADGQKNKHDDCCTNGTARDPMMEPKLDWVCSYAILVYSKNELLLRL